MQKNMDSRTMSSKKPSQRIERIPTIVEYPEEGTDYFGKPAVVTWFFVLTLLCVLLPTAFLIMSLTVRLPRAANFAAYSLFIFCCCLIAFQYATITWYANRWAENRHGPFDYRSCGSDTEHDELHHASESAVEYQTASKDMRSARDEAHRPDGAHLV